MEINPDVPTWDDLMDEVVWASLTAESIEPMDVAPESLSAEEAVGYLAALQRVQARLAALEARALVAAAGPYVGMHEVTVHDRETERARILAIADDIRDELAAALHRSSNSMHDDLVTARLLAGPLAATARSLAAGRITPATRG